MESTLGKGEDCAHMSNLLLQYFAKFYHTFGVNKGKILFNRKKNHVYGVLKCVWCAVAFKSYVYKVKEIMTECNRFSIFVYIINLNLSSLFTSI